MNVMEQWRAAWAMLIFWSRLLQRMCSSRPGCLPGDNAQPQTERCSWCMSVSHLSNKAAD